VTNNTLPWDIARSGGLVTYVLLTISMLFGTAVAARAFRNKPGLPWMNGMHEWIGTLTLGFLGVHVLGLLMDTYIGFSLVDVLVPFASHYRPGTLAWGVVAFYLLLVVELSARLRGKLPRKWRHLWKRAHYAAYPLFIVSTVHLLTIGTDSRTLPVLLLVAAAIAGVLAAVARSRWLRAQRAPKAQPRVAPVDSAVRRDELVSQLLEEQPNVSDDAHRLSRSSIG
jgi:predicted ferric reductase